MTNPPSCLEEAIETVKQRQAVYGKPGAYFLRFANLLANYLNHPVTPAQAAMILLLGKVARLMESPSHRDSVVDIAGYVDCYAKASGVDTP